MTDEELDALRDELEDLRAENDRLQAEAADVQARIRDLTDENAALRARSDTLEEANDAAEARLSAAAGELRRVALESNPDLPPEMVGGDTVDEVVRSIADASATVARLRERIEEERAAAEPARVPSGAPVRRGTGGGSLSPRDKIAEGLRRTPR